MTRKRLTRKQEFKKAQDTGEWTRWDKIKHWNPGGHLPRHNSLRRARRLAEKNLHFLTRFMNGMQMGPKHGDEDTYTAECRYCNRYVVVAFYVGEEPRIFGTALTTCCGE